MKRRINNILFAVGVISVVIMLVTFDVSWQTLWDSLLRAGYWPPAMLVLWVVLYALNTVTWWTLLREGGPCPVGFLRLYKITITGFALNAATPVGLLGGEPYKIMEMTPHVGVQRATSSVLLFAMMHVFAHFWYWVTAIVLYLLFLPLGPGMGVLLTIASLFCAAGIYLFLKGYKNGMAVRGIRWLGHIPGLRKWAQRLSEERAEDLQKIDRQIAELHSQSRRTFYTAFFLEYFGRMMHSLEIMFMLLLFGAPWSWMTYVQSVLILAFTSLFANLLGFIPLQLGGREGGFAMSTSQLGLTGEIGLFICIICRVRELFFTSLGLRLMKVK